MALMEMYQIYSRKSNELICTAYNRRTAQMLLDMLKQKFNEPIAFIKLLSIESISDFKKLNKDN